MNNSRMTQDEQNIWNEFVAKHPRVVEKILWMTFQETKDLIVRRGKSVFSTFCSAMWMSMTVLICIHAFTPMFGFLVAAFIGSAVCVVADKALTGLAVLIADKTEQLLLNKEEQNDRDSSSSNR